MMFRGLHRLESPLCAVSVVMPEQIGKQQDAVVKRLVRDLTKSLSDVRGELFQRQRE